MEFIFNKKYQIIIAAILLLTLVFLIVAVNGLNKKKPTEPITNDKTPISGYMMRPTTVLLNNFNYRYSKTVNVLPTLPPSEGEGIDTNSPLVKNSVEELQKIQNKLPYKKTILTNSGMEVEVVISSNDMMDNPWTLLVNMNGIDFQIDEDDKNYEATKTAFLITVQDVYYWLKSQGVDTEKIIIQWGDRALVQSRATLWLK